jgi:hypothetical protein
MNKIEKIDVGNIPVYEVENLINCKLNNKPYSKLTKWEIFKKYKLWVYMEIFCYLLIFIFIMLNQF